MRGRGRDRQTDRKRQRDRDRARVCRKKKVVAEGGRMRMIGFLTSFA